PEFRGTRRGRTRPIYPELSRGRRPRCRTWRRSGYHWHRCARRTRRIMKRTGNIAINGELHYGTVHFAERIERIDIISSDPKAGQDTIIPGFVDVHVHGGGGADTMDGPDGVYTLARFHRSYGTTALLPTTITERTEAITTALHG